ncbi:MAG: hypothetical protein IMY72_03615 [Bacteroidetes bacterium]|nr:hypothetical protein [Bacteroidota bacterium]
MNYKYKILEIVSVLLVLLLNSCQDLDIKYKNLPDMETVYNDPTNVYNVAKAGFFNYYMINTSSISPRMSMWVMADQGTCSWGNSGMLDLSSEPRMPFNNDVSYTYANIFETYWADIYGNISQVNDVLSVINEGMEIGDDSKDTEMIRANCYFIQGLSLGYLGLVYDKAFIMDENVNTEIDTITTYPYSEVTQAALASLEKCIEISEKNDFSIPADWFGGSEYTNTELAQLAHSFSARFMVYMPRNASENSLTDWQAVYDHANNGIQRDLAPYMDNVNWINWFYHYTVRPDWAKIDLRIINLMDSSYPYYYPEDGSALPPASSKDKRLETDFNYVSIINMKPERGYYHFSNYEYSRYEYNYVLGVNTGEVTEFSAEENMLFKAEALVHLSNLPAAIGIINNGSRVIRGSLDPVPANATEDQVLKAIFYERDIELIMTGFGTAFFDMRRRDMLQTGTLLHLPIPAKELMLLQKSIYTFGGIGNADGINTSNGGWFPEK